MSWPTHSDYQESIQNPSLCFQEDDLKAGEIKADMLGLPRVISGNFASVYELTTAGKRWAIRCFVRQVPGQQGRYIILTKYLANMGLNYLVRFDFMLQGILVRKEWFPVVKMEWVEGAPLNSWIEQNARQPQKLLEMAARFRVMMKGLRENKIAHGDLQHGNIMVTPADELRLVDYDGMYCPAFGRGHAPELGHPNFQHPRRTADYYEEGLDNFSALVIHMSLLAMVGEPEIFDKYYNVDNLILSASDFKNPMQAPVFKRLLQSQDPQVQKLTGLLQKCCVAPIEQVPWYEDTLVKLEAGEPLTLGTPAPMGSRPAPLPAPVGSRPASTPVVPPKTTPAPPASRPAPPRPAPSPAPAKPTRGAPKEMLLPALAVVIIVLLCAIGYKLFFSASKPAGKPAAPESTAASPSAASPAPAPTTAPPQASKINLLGTLKGHTKTVQTLIFSPDRRLFASGSADGTARIWDLQTGELKFTLAGHADGVVSIAWLGDGKSLATVSGDFTAKIWDTATGAARKTIADYQQNSWPPVFSPDGRTLATGANNRKVVRLLDWTTGAVRTTLPEQKSWVRGADFSADGRLLATYCFDDGVNIWNLAGGQLVKSLVIPTNGMDSVVFNHNQTQIATAGENSTVKLYSLSSAEVRSLAGHIAQVRALAFSPNGKLLVSGGADRSIRVWEMPSGRPLHNFKAHNEAVTSLAITSDSAVLVSGSVDNAIKLWDIGKL